jgi:serine/threonine protein kinase
LFDVPPAAIGRFRVLHQVGAGTSGPVFRAVHPETDAPLAIKLFTLSFPPERVTAFVADLESRVTDMPALDGACQLVDAGTHGSTPYLVTSFAQGDSLDVALKQFGPAAIVDLVPRLRTLARALDAAASDDVLHGALHPRDVLVSDSSTVLAGLGIWPILVRAGERYPIRRPYRAPELSDSTASAAGDQFSLAALAYEWMTGRRAPSTFVAGDMAPIAGADRELLGSIFGRALHADPDNRYPSCDAFVRDLADVEVEEVAVVAVEKPRLEQKPRKRGGRVAPRPASLPMEVFPSEEASELRLAPAPAEEPATPPPSLRADAFEPEDEDVAPPSPAAAGKLRPLPVAEPPSHSLLRETSYIAPSVWPPAPSGGGKRLMAGLLLGAVLGVGAGYAVWGPSGAWRFWGRLAGGEAAGTAEAPINAGGQDAAVPPESASPPAPANTSPTREPEPEPTPVPSAPPPGGPSASTGRASSTAAPSPAGNLLVRSTPAGATVFVDEERRGVTPLALQNVELGTRRVRILRDGFNVEERQVNLTRSRPSRSVDVRLTRAASAPRPAAPAPEAAPTARTGSLVIESRPTGATIILNGRQVGTTPMTIDDLEPGTYTVQLQLADFRPIRTTVRVVAGARARAAASLVSAQEPQ